MVTWNSIRALVSTIYRVHANNINMEVAEHDFLKAPLNIRISKEIQMNRSFRNDITTVDNSNQSEYQNLHVYFEPCLNRR